MRWLRSTTQKAWTVGLEGKQFVIPPVETPDSRFLMVDEVEFSKIEKLPVIASLIKAGGIMVLNQEPAELKNSVPQLQVTNTQLRAENDTLRARVTELETQLKNATNIDIEKIKADAVAPVQKALEDSEQRYKQLKDEAEQALADKDAEISKLEKKLKKTGE